MTILGFLKKIFKEERKEENERKLIKLLEIQNARLSYFLEKTEQLQAAVTENTVVHEELIFCLQQSEHEIDFVNTEAELEATEDYLVQTKNVFDVN
jgi:hypothetical protein